MTFAYIDMSKAFAWPDKPFVHEIVIVQNCDANTDAEEKYGHDDHPEARAWLKRYRNSEVWFIGVTVEAEVRFRVPREKAGRRQWFSSPGLWGLESDDDIYIEQVAREEYASLLETLAVFGVTNTFTFEQVRTATRSLVFSAPSVSEFTHRTRKSNRRTGRL
ncbi:MAG: hypothetical protein ABSF69_17735 [Polyangiaceae bacterium]|jgi:hypothetical protein